MLFNCYIIDIERGTNANDPWITHRHNSQYRESIKLHFILGNSNWTSWKT